MIDTAAPTSNLKSLSAVFRITAKTGNAITVSPALPFTFTSSPRLVQYSLPPLVNAGIEELTIDGNAMAGIGIEFDQAWGSWVKNVETKNIVSRQMLFVVFVNGEVRGNYAHDVIGGGPNKEGLDFFQDASFNLIEDNIVYNGGFPGIVLGDSKGGCAGNVIAYNFSYATNVGVSDYGGADISISHGSHNVMNVVEGNVAGGVLSDGYFGSTSHIVIFRNWLTATHPTGIRNLIAVNIGRWNNYFSIVGNVLGSSKFSPTMGLLQPEQPFAYENEVIYKLGFPNLGNNGFTGTWASSVPPDYRLQSATGNNFQERDDNVKTTLIRHGNYDFLSKSTTWDASISNRVLPDSLVYTNGKPAWWPVGKAWPLIGPDQSPMTGSVPALDRFKALNTGQSTPP